MRRLLIARAQRRLWRGTGTAPPSGGGGGGGGGSSSNWITAKAHRFLPGTNVDTLCAFGFPLPPGKLTPAQLTAGYGKAVVNGAEVASYVEQPAGSFVLHPDGSLRMVYLQALVPGMTAGVPIDAQFRCDELRTSALARTLTDPIAYLNSPSAQDANGNYYAYEDLYNIEGAILPANAVDICDSGLFPYVRPRTENPQAPSVAATYATKYDQSWDTYEPTAGRWDGSNSRAWYYDAFKMYLDKWAQTGNAAYVKRGVAQYARIRTAYWAPNSFATQEYYLGIQGWAYAYFFLRDIPARDTGIGRFALQGTTTSYLMYTSLGNGNASAGTTRYASNTLRGITWGYLTGYTGGSVTTQHYRSVQKALCDPAGPALSVSPSFGTITVDDGINPTFTVAVSSRQGQADDASASTKQVCIPFQDAMLCDSLMTYYDFVNPTQFVLDRIKLMADNWWTYFQRPYPDTTNPTGNRGHNFFFATTSYSSASAGISGSASQSVDLSGFFARVYYWLAWRLSDSSYLVKGDGIADAQTHTPYDGSNGPFLSVAGSNTASGSYKQFRENFFLSSNQWGLRTLAATATGYTG
jgi:hypothetical protein